MLLANVLNEPIFHPIKEYYERWYTFMEEKVEFWLPDSEWHKTNYPMMKKQSKILRRSICTK